MSRPKRKRHPEELDDDTRKAFTQLLDWWDADPEELRPAWAAHGERITAEYRERMPGERPPAWWHYLTDVGDRPRPGGDTAWLREHGYLTEGEERALAARPDPGPPDDD